MARTPAAESASPWWEGSVIYELIPRCFADGNGDGIGLVGLGLGGGGGGGFGLI